MCSQTRRSRFYAPDLRDVEITISPDEARHALHVLRLREGALVELFDGKGTAAEGEIIRFASSRRAAQAEVVVRPAERRQHPSPKAAVHLNFAVPKGKRLDWLLEKATELGAASLRPIGFHRSTPGAGRSGKLSPAQRNRWFTHCIAAGKQCGLNWLPVLEEYAELDDFLASSFPGVRLVGDPGDDALPLSAAMDKSPADEPVVLLVGPEGGFTDAERDAIVHAGFIPTSLGPNTLRVETAAVALLAAIWACRGR